MPRVKVHLSIGYPTAVQEDIIEVDDEAYESCKTDEERDELLQTAWDEWSSNYISGYYEIIK